MSESQVITLPDGRSLCYSTFGTSIHPDRPTVFYFHGFPGTHHEGELFHEAASQKGIQLIAITRPGFGGSTYQPNRTLLSFPQDVLALADHLNIQRFAVAGISGGGPYALACVKAIPPARLLGTVVICGMYPLKLGTTGMMLANRMLFYVASWTTWLVALVLDWSMGKLA